MPGADLARRFGGVLRLYGPVGLERLQAAHVLIAGIGGVGSWAAEALARSGVGKLTLVDLDHIAESNINRQVHALESSLGASKIGTMAQRIADISPACELVLVDDFLSVQNLDAYVPREAHVVIDAIDQARVKAALIAHCHGRLQPIVVCSAAGGRTDPLSLRRDDLALTRGDALLAGVRARLRRDHGFTRQAGRAFGVSAIFSSESVTAVADSADVSVDYDDVAGFKPADVQAASEVSPRGGAALACSGYGSIVTVTASMGFAAAQSAINSVLRR